jgi:hypothetical protein
MSKEGLKEDILNDITRLLNKESNDKKENDIFENKNIDMNKNIQEQDMQEIPAHILSQMQQQMQPQMYQQMQPQMQQMHPQMQHQMQQQMEQQMQQQIHNQLQQQMAQQQMQQQLAQQQMAQQQMAQQQMAQQQMPPELLAQLQQRQQQKQVHEHMQQVNKSNSELFSGSDKCMDSTKNMIYMIREPLVLLLLFSIILTPQVNKILNKIPYTVDAENYPGYLGILLRGLILVSIFVIVQKLNLI